MENKDEARENLLKYNNYNSDSEESSLDYGGSLLLDRGE